MRKNKKNNSVIKQLNDRSAGISKRSRKSSEINLIQSLNTKKYPNSRLPNNNPSNGGHQLVSMSGDVYSFLTQMNWEDRLLPPDGNAQIRLNSQGRMVYGKPKPYTMISKSLKLPPYVPGPDGPEF